MKFIRAPRSRRRAPHNQVRNRRSPSFLSTLRYINYADAFVKATLLSMLLLCASATNFASHVSYEAPFSYNYLGVLHADGAYDVEYDPALLNTSAPALQRRRAARSNITFSEAVAVVRDRMGEGWYVVGNIEVGPSFDGNLSVIDDADGDTLYKVDMFVAKVRGDGGVQWIRRMGSIGDDKATGVVCGDDGFIFVIGYVPNGATRGAVLFKLDGNTGERIWVRSYGSRAGKERLLSIAAVPPRFAYDRDLRVVAPLNETESDSASDTWLIISGTTGALSTLVPGGGAMLLLVNATDGALHSSIQPQSHDAASGVEADRATLSSLTVQRVKRAVSGASVVRQAPGSGEAGETQSPSPSPSPSPVAATGQPAFVDTDDVLINSCGYIDVGLLNAALFSFLLRPASSSSATVKWELSARETRLVPYRQNEYFLGSATAVNGGAVYCVGLRAVSDYEERDARVLSFNASAGLGRGWQRTIGSRRFETLFDAQQGRGQVTEEGRAVGRDEYGNLYVMLRSTSAVGGFSLGRQQVNTKQVGEKGEEESQDRVVSERPALFALAPNGEFVEAIQPKSQTQRPVTANDMDRSKDVIVVVGKADSSAVLTAARIRPTTRRFHQPEFVPPPSPSPGGNNPNSPDDPLEGVSGAQGPGEEAGDVSSKSQMWVILGGTLGGVLFAVAIVSVACLITRGAVRRAKGIEKSASAEK